MFYYTAFDRLKSTLVDGVATHYSGALSAADYLSRATPFGGSRCADSALRGLYANGMVQSMTVTPPNGSAKVTTHYDSLGNMTSVVDGLGHTTTYSGYNGLGEPGKVVGPNGAETDYAYDARGRVVTKTTHPNGTPATWSYTYDGFGLLANLTAPGNDVTTWTRNPYMQVASITHNDKDGTSTESFTYDDNGDITSEVVKRGSDIGKSSNFVYDGLGRIYQRKGTHGQVLTYAYDGNGNVLSVTDALGHKTSYQYDALNRVVKMVDADGGATQYAYDAGDHLTKVIDPRGLVTTYSYDGLGLLWSQTSPDTGATTFNYDSYARLASKTRADGIQSVYAYDALNRLTKITAGSLVQTWSYDTCTNGLGRLCSAAGARTAISYSYTPEGWVQGRGFTVDGTTYSLGYSYDSAGRLAVINYPDGNQALYYYTNGVVSKIDLQVGRYLVISVSGITYRPMDSATSAWESYNGLINTISYDSDLRPSSISVPGVQSLAFTYDTADRITEITNGLDSTMTQTLGYDALNRLTGVSSGAENESYFYDANGNRLSQTVNGSLATYTIDASSNRLLSEVSGNETTQFNYDPQGNLTGGSVSGGSDSPAPAAQPAAVIQPPQPCPLTSTTCGPITPPCIEDDGCTPTGGGGTQPPPPTEGSQSRFASFHYNAFNRMDSVTTSTATNYDVNPEGQRLRKYTSISSTYFAPDIGGKLLAEDINGTWYDYVWLNGKLVEVIANGGIFSLHDDQTGRPQVMTEPNGTSIDWAAQNKPFDRTVTTNAWGPFNIGFPGQYFDEEDGLYYNGHRDYDPTLGRYIEFDPIGLRGGINTYVYASSNPISIVDPSGLDGVGHWTYAPGSPDAQNYQNGLNGCYDKQVDEALTATVIVASIIGGGEVVIASGNAPKLVFLALSQLGPTPEYDVVESLQGIEEIQEAAETTQTPPPPAAPPPGPPPPPGH